MITLEQVTEAAANNPAEFERLSDASVDEYDQAFTAFDTFVTAINPGDCLNPRGLRAELSGQALLLGKAAAEASKYNPIGFTFHQTQVYVAALSAVEAALETWREKYPKLVKGS